MYEKQDGNGMSLDKLLSQAGFSDEEKRSLAPDAEEQPKSPEEAAADAEEAAGRLTKLPGIPSFLNPRVGGFRRTPRTAGRDYSTAGTTADDSQGPGFKVTVHVSPDGETTPQPPDPYAPVTFFSHRPGGASEWAEGGSFLAAPSPVEHAPQPPLDPACIPSTMPTVTGGQAAVGSNAASTGIPSTGLPLTDEEAAALSGAAAGAAAGLGGAAGGLGVGMGSAAATQSMAPVGLGSAPAGGMGVTGPIGPLVPPSPAQWTYGVDMAGAPYAADVHGVAYPLDGNGNPYTYDASGSPYTVDPYGMPSAYNDYSMTSTTPEAAGAVAAMKNEMDDASRSHRKFRKLMVALIIVVAVLAIAVIGLVVAVSTGAVDMPGISGGGSSSSASSSSSSGSSASSSSSSSSGSSSSSSSSGSAGASAGSSGAASGGATGGDGGGSLAGDVQFYYNLTTAEGEHPSCHETVTFNEQGLCVKSVLRATFDSQAAAAAFVTRVERDYGRAYLGGSVDGTTGTVEVNMTSSRLTRQEYESALRTTVEDLRVEG